MDPGEVAGPRLLVDSKSLGFFIAEDIQKAVKRIPDGTLDHLNKETGGNSRGAGAVAWLSPHCARRKESIQLTRKH